MTHTCAHAPTRLVLMTRGLLLCTCMVAAQDARHPQQAAAMRCSACCNKEVCLRSPHLAAARLCLCDAPVAPGARPPATPFQVVGAAGRDRPLELLDAGAVIDVALLRCVTCARPRSRG
jgi:hypothetical protein